MTDTGIDNSRTFSKVISIYNFYGQIGGELVFKNSQLSGISVVATAM